MNTIGGMDPLSRQFQTTATNNMATQMGTVKNEKDLKPKDEGLDPQDKADIRAMIDASTVTAEEGATAAANSGELAELTDDMTEDDEEKIERRHVSEEEAAAEAARSTRPGAVQVAASEGRDELRAVEIRADQEKMAGIRAGIPDEVYTAAEQVVKGQIIDDTQPTKGLAELKPVDSAGVAPPEGSLPMADIHDTHNAPISDIPPEESVPPELKAKAAELEAAQVAAAARASDEPTPAASGAGDPAATQQAAATPETAAGPADAKEAYEKMLGLSQGLMGDFNALTVGLFYQGRTPDDLLANPPFRRKSADEAGADLATAVDYLARDHSRDSALPDALRASIAGQGEDVKRYLDQANNAMERELTERGVPKEQWNLHLPAYLSREIMADQPNGQPRSKCLYMAAYHYLNSQEVAEAMGKGEAPPPVVAAPASPGPPAAAAPAFGGGSFGLAGAPAPPTGFPRLLVPPPAASPTFAPGPSSTAAWTPPAGNRLTPSFLAAAGVRMPGSTHEEAEAAEEAAGTEAAPAEGAQSLPDPGVTGTEPFQYAVHQSGEAVHDFHRLASLAATTRKPVEDLATGQLPFERKPFEQAAEDLEFAVRYVMSDHSHDAAVPENIKPALASQREDVARYIDDAKTRMSSELEEKGVPRDEWHCHFPAYLCREIMADQPDGQPKSKGLYMTAFHYLNCRDAHEALRA